MFIQLSYLAMLRAGTLQITTTCSASGHDLYGTLMLGGVLLTAGLLGVPVRLYQFTALACDYADFGQKYRWLFPAVLLLDAVWAATPLLFLGQLHGLVLLCAAALAYLPFSQRTLLYFRLRQYRRPLSAIQPPGK